MPRVALPMPVLTQEQKDYIKKNWDKDLRSLTQELFPDKEITLRNIECRAVKQELASLGREPSMPISDNQQKAIEILSQDHKDYIAQNYQQASSPLELARTIFANSRLIEMSRECRGVVAYIKQIDPDYNKKDDLADDIEYRPPVNLIQLLHRVNKYAQLDNVLNPQKLSEAQKRQLEALWAYMKMPLFKSEADKYIRKTDREVFESTFIANCWDKPDLSNEHVIQFVFLSGLIVKQNVCDRQLQKVELIIADKLDGDLTNGRLSKNEVDMVNQLREKTMEILKQVGSLIKTLTGQRADMIKEKVLGAGSMHPLVEAWKREEDRKRIIKLAEKHRDDLKKEVERLSSMDALKAELFGLDKDNIIR
jgi:hypothetical protein